MSYCQFLGIEYDKEMNLTDSMPALFAPEQYYTDHKTALKTRTEYKLLEQSVNAEEIQTKMKMGSYLPEFGIGASASYVNVLGMDKVNAIVFGKLSVPLSGWWDATYVRQERQLKEQIARNNAEENSELLLLQMQKAYFEMNESYKQIEFGENSLAQAEENLKEYDSNFKSGIINISDLLQAQALLQESQEKLIELRSNYLQKVNIYFNVIGK